MDQYLAEECLGSDGKVTKQFHDCVSIGDKHLGRHKQPVRKCAKHIRSEVKMHDSNDNNDSDFAEESSDEEVSDTKDGSEILTNAEVHGTYMYGTLLFN